MAVCAERLTEIKGQFVHEKHHEEQKRDYSRLPKEVAVEVQILIYPLAQGNGTKGRSKNIANNGLCFTAAEEYARDTVLNIKIDLRGMRQHMKSVSAIINEARAAAPFSVVAKVVWCRADSSGHGYEIGAEFVDVYEDEQKALNAYLSGLLDRM